MDLNKLIYFCGNECLIFSPWQLLVTTSDLRHIIESTQHWHPLPSPVTGGRTWGSSRQHCRTSQAPSLSHPQDASPLQHPGEMAKALQLDGFCFNHQWGKFDIHNKVFKPFLQWVAMCWAETVDSNLSGTPAMQRDLHHCWFCLCSAWGGMLDFTSHSTPFFFPLQCFITLWKKCATKRFHWLAAVGVVNQHGHLSSQATDLWCRRQTGQLNLFLMRLITDYHTYCYT